MVCMPDRLDTLAVEARRHGALNASEEENPDLRSVKLLTGLSPLFVIADADAARLAVAVETRGPLAGAFQDRADVGGLAAELGGPGLIHQPPGLVLALVHLDIGQV